MFQEVGVSFCTSPTLQTCERRQRVADLSMHEGVALSRTVHMRSYRMMLSVS